MLRGGFYIGNKTDKFVKGPEIEKLIIRMCGILRIFGQRNKVFKVFSEKSKSQKVNLWFRWKKDQRLNNSHHHHHQQQQQHQQQHGSNTLLLNMTNVIFVFLISEVYVIYELFHNKDQLKGQRVFENTDESRVSDPHFFLRIRIQIRAKIFMRIRIRIRILGVSGGGGWGSREKWIFFEFFSRFRWFLTTDA